MEESSDFAVDPIVNRHLTGWARYGSRVAIFIDDVPVGAVEATRTRSFVYPRQPYKVGGYDFKLPSNVVSGGAYRIRLVLDDGKSRSLNYKPLSGVSLNILHSTRELIAGRIRFAKGTPTDTLGVAATIDGEIVSVAQSRHEGTHRSQTEHKFMLRLPGWVSRSGHRLINVSPIGCETDFHCRVVLPKPVPTHVATVVQEAPVSMSIKIAAPSLAVAHEWGDFHFARQLAAAIGRRGWLVRVDCQDEWKKVGDDLVLVLRGRQRYIPDGKSASFLWQISHPTQLSAAEARDFDHVFVASEVHVATLAKATSTPVSVLHQATDPSVFHEPVVPVQLSFPTIFVGNSRGNYRTIVRWCVDQKLDVSVFGNSWHEILPDRMLEASHIRNEELHRWYGSCDILLNDHWDDMRVNGFLSNRLFDGSAAGAFIISDDVRGLHSVFGDSIEVVSNARELRSKMEYYMRNPEARSDKSSRAKEIVLNSHTFDHRAAEIISRYQSIMANRNNQLLLHRSN